MNLFKETLIKSGAHIEQSDFSGDCIKCVQDDGKDERKMSAEPSGMIYSVVP